MSTKNVLNTLDFDKFKKFSLKNYLREKLFIWFAQLNAKRSPTIVQRYERIDKLFVNVALILNEGIHFDKKKDANILWIIGLLFIWNRHTKHFLNLFDLILLNFLFKRRFLFCDSDFSLFIEYMLNCEMRW